MMNPFAAPLERIRNCRYHDEDEDGSRQFKVRKPASPKLRRAVTEWARGKIPRELEDFMALTSGIVGSATLDLKVSFEAGSGPSGVWSVYDYGNGDCLGLDDEGDRCTVWWIGHDPWGIIFVRDSLLAYVNDLADFAEQTANDEAPDDEVLFRPRVDLLPRTGADLPDLKLPAESVVYDFTGCAPRTHADLSKIPPHARRFARTRVGRHVIAQPLPAVAAQVVQASEKVERAIAMAMMEQLPQARVLLDEALILDPGHTRAVEWMTMLDQREAGR